MGKHALHGVGHRGPQGNRERAIDEVNRRATGARGEAGAHAAHHSLAQNQHGDGANGHRDGEPGGKARKGEREKVVGHGNILLVREAGLEPARPKTLDPKSSAYANFATRARVKDTRPSAARGKARGNSDSVNAEVAAQSRYVPGRLDVVARVGEFAFGANDERGPQRARDESCRTATSRPTRRYASWIAWSGSLTSVYVSCSFSRNSARTLGLVS